MATRHRFRVAIATVGAGMLATLASLTAHATDPTSSASPAANEGACQSAGFVGTVVCGVTGAVGHAASSAAGAVAGSVVGAAEQAFTGWVASGAAAVLRVVADTLTSLGTPDLQAPWYRSHYALMWDLAFSMMALVFVITIVHGAVIRHDPLGILIATFVRMPAAVLGSGLALALVSASLAITDWMSSVVMGTGMSDVDRLTEGLITHFLSGTAPSAIVDSIVLALGSLTLVVGGLVIVVELIVRQAAVYIAVLYVPLLATAAIWPPAGRWMRRLAELLFALVISKLVVVTILSTIAGMVLGSTNASSTPGGISTFIAGVGGIWLAAIAPLKLMSLMPSVEASVHLSGHGTQVARSVAGTAGSYARTRARQRVAAATTAGERSSADPQGRPSGPFSLSAGTLASRAQGSGRAGRGSAPRREGPKPAPDGSQVRRGLDAPNARQPRRDSGPTSRRDGQQHKRRWPRKGGTPK